MHELITNRRLGDVAPDAAFWPAVGADLQPLLEAGEVIRWRGGADISQQVYGQRGFKYTWSLVETADVTITDRRLIFGGKTKTYRQPGAISGVISGLRAGDRPATNIHIGQIRFDWPTNVMLSAQRVMRFTITTLSLTCRAADGTPVRLVLTALEQSGRRLDHRTVATIASALVRDIARHRLQRETPRAPGIVDPLIRQRDQPTPVTVDGISRWDLPGDLLVGTVAHRRVTTSTHDAVRPRPSAGEAASTTGAAAPANPPPPAVPDRPRPARLLDKVAAAGAALLALFALTSLPNLGASASAIEQRNVAREADAAGDVRTATRAWRNVLINAPRSTEALLRLSCLMWEHGYQDEAVTYYQRALAAGVPWDAPVIAANCFVNAPSLHRLRVVELRRLGPVVYVAPARADGDSDVLTAIVTGDPAPDVRDRLIEAVGPSLEPSTDQVILSVACLNDRAGLTLVASLNFGIALNSQQLGPVHGVLRECVLRMPERYVFTEQRGLELYFPTDMSERIFLAETSPLRSRTARVLP